MLEHTILTAELILVFLLIFCLLMMGSVTITILFRFAVSEFKNLYEFIKNQLDP